ncbi:methyl-accepting chemotaxis sensory transducer with Cache sensor [Rhizobiales bacterium GAS191]|nr:methyl-accepting chemotaxis sensory transducer with Cache sensor [Rhizobiales bacterium GAS191]
MKQPDEKTGGRRVFKTIRSRLAAIVALFAFALVAVVTALTWMGADAIYAARRDQLRTVSEVANKVIEQQYQEFKAGKISEAEAQLRAKAAVRAMRYNTNDYFFVQDDVGTSIVHGARPDQEGVVSNTVALDGRPLSLAMHETAVAKGAGFVEYQYAKPGGALDNPSPKLSYVKWFAPWKWVLGTGVYIDDVSAQIWQRIYVSAGIGLGFLLAIGGLACVVVLGLSRRLNDLSQAMVSLAEGKSDVELPAMRSDDEIGRMAQAVQVFKDAAIEKTRLEAQAGTTHRHAEEARAAHEAEKAEEARQLQFATDALGEGMEHLASGDLAFRLETPFQAKVDKLRLDFNRSVEKLQHTMLTIASNTKGIGSGTEEISRAADDMSRRTEQQAASLEETAAALDEITATVKKTAEGAAHAREVVSNAKTDAEKSGEVVREAIKAMGGIEKSSQQIGQIIGVIDEIAFQTNLLALNAGVEAARAGDAGRGFAVVASEVRALAQRSAEAAKEIKALISTSSTQVEQGVDLVGKAGQALERIATQIAEMNTVIADIAVGAREQATGLQQVNTAINQMDQGTQQSAAMAEESTAATHALAQESDELVQLVSQFQLSTQAAGKGSAKVEPMRARAANSSSAKPFSVNPSSGKPQPALRAVASRRGETAVRKAEAAPDADGWEEF